MKDITLEVKKFLKKKSKIYDRLEIVVSDEFELGNKWAKMLGFIKEYKMEKYFNGVAHNLYVILRGKSNDKGR
jgi:uncharacterized ferritin-like protein (DUF455 family)